MNFDFQKLLDGHVGGFLKEITDKEFQQAVAHLEEHARNGEFDENPMTPSFLVLGINPKGEGLEVGMIPFNFPAYKTSSQLRVLNKFARTVMVEHELYPIAAFIVAEAGCYSPNKEETERIQSASEDEQAELIKEIAMKAKQEGRNVDIVTIAGMTHRREHLFYAHVIDHDESGVLHLLDDEENESGFPTRIIEGLGKEEGDAESAANTVGGAGIDTIHDFFACTRPFMLKLMLEKASPEVIEKIKEDHGEDVFDRVQQMIDDDSQDDEAFANSVNQRTRNRWTPDN